MTVGNFWSSKYPGLLTTGSIVWMTRSEMLFNWDKFHNVFKWLVNESKYWIMLSMHISCCYVFTIVSSIPVVDNFYPTSSGLECNGLVGCNDPKKNNISIKSPRQYYFIKFYKWCTILFIFPYIFIYYVWNLFIMKLSIYKECLIMTHLHFIYKNSEIPSKQRLVQI